MQYEKQISAILWQIARRGLIEATRRADTARQIDGEEVATLVDPAAELLKRLVSVERDHVRAGVLTPVAGTLIHKVVHLIDTYRRAVRVHLATILSVKVHECRVVAAYVRLRFEELRSACNVPAAITRVRRVTVADACVDHACWLSMLFKSAR